MAETAPIVYILHGEDEFAIAQALGEMEARLGDPLNAALNTTRIEGSSFQPDELMSVAGVMPFLAKRRLVILSGVVSRLEQSKIVREKFLAQLEKIPPTTALIITETNPLTSERDRRKKKQHWLEAWAREHKERAWIRSFALPKGREWVQRVQEMAQKHAGQFSPGAADLLYQLTDGDLRLADQEVQKLVAYVNYRRPVEADDVEALTADVGQGDIFALVDAMGNRDGRKALAMLRRLLEYSDYYAIFGMAVRQFRMLVQARAVLDEGGGREEIIRGLKLYGSKAFLADRLIGQVRHFSLSDLKRIYHKLLDIDEVVKTSRMSGDLALEMLVASLAAVPQR